MDSIKFSTISKSKMSLFVNCVTSKPAGEISLGELIDLVKTGKYSKSQTTARKKLSEGRKEDYSKYKTTGMHAVTLSATFESERKNKTRYNHSRLLQIDIDEQDNRGIRPAKIKKQLSQDPHIVFASTSINPKCVKSAVIIDPKRHKEGFEAAKRYFQDTFGLKIDPQCSDIPRLFIIPSDKTIYVADQIMPLRYVGCSDVGSSYIDVDIDELESVTPPKIELSISQKQEIAKKWEALQQDTRPKILNLYKSLVEIRVDEISPGRRNDAICKLIPFLFRAVGKKPALELLELHYSKYECICNDPIQQHMSEANHVWNALDKEYRNELTTNEAAHFDLLASDQERIFFRIIRDLAVNNTKRPKELFIPMEQFGYRMDTSASRISRLIEKFRSIDLQILYRIKKGLPRKAGIKTKAGLYWYVL